VFGVIHFINRGFNEEPFGEADEFYATVFATQVRHAAISCHDLLCHITSCGSLLHFSLSYHILWLTTPLLSVIPHLVAHDSTSLCHITSCGSLLHFSLSYHILWLTTPLLSVISHLVAHYFTSLCHTTSCGSLLHFSLALPIHLSPSCPLPYLSLTHIGADDSSVSRRVQSHLGEGEAAVRADEDTHRTRASDSKGQGSILLFHPHPFSLCLSLRVSLSLFLSLHCLDLCALSVLVTCTLHLNFMARAIYRD
jgi:hypothetical protein